MLPNTDKTEGPLRTIGERFLADGDEAICWSIDRSRYEPREVERGRRSWIMRMLDEYRSMVSFGELFSQLTELQAPLDVIASASRVLKDEVRHVDLCRRMVDALGGVGGADQEPRWVRSDPARPLRERVLRSVVASLAIGETASAAMIGGVRQEASDPTARAVLTQMLSDESFHGRFGFFALDAIFGRRTADEEKMLRALLPRALATVERACVGGLGPRPGYRSSPFGSMHPDTRREIFYRCVSDRILPELEARGLPAGSAWARRPAMTEGAS